MHILLKYACITAHRFQNLSVIDYLFCCFPVFFIVSSLGAGSKGSLPGKLPAPMQSDAAVYSKHLSRAYHLPDSDEMVVCDLPQAQIRDCYVSSSLGIYRGSLKPKTCAFSLHHSTAWNHAWKQLLCVSDKNTFPLILLESEVQPTSHPLWNITCLKRNGSPSLHDTPLKRWRLGWE